jgi:nucleoside-diphosphate-sugar epimerase
LKTKILLTGATGFLGSHLLKNFILNKYEVVILKRSTSNLWRISDFPKEYTSYDVNKVSALEVFEKEKPNIIVHTACSYGKGNECMSDTVKTNLIFGLEIFEAALKYESEVFINTDSLLPRDINSYSLSKSQFSDWLKKGFRDTSLVPE